MSWNEILFTSVLTARGSRTLSVGLLEINGPAHMMAACVIVSVPVIIFLSLLRKRYIRGFFR